jgi:hypothetical protein
MVGKILTVRRWPEAPVSAPSNEEAPKAKNKDLGEVRTEITLVNIGDQSAANRGYMPKEQVRRVTVNAVVDTGARTGTAGPLVINEETREKLGLLVEESKDATLAGGKSPLPDNGAGTDLLEGPQNYL